MKLRMRLLTILSLAVVLLFPSVAFAQTGASDALPAVTLPIAVTTVVSLLLGLVNMVAQGSILNLVTVPKVWAGPATIVGTFLTGAGSFLATAAQPWTDSTAFYAFAFGLFGLFGGALPAFAVHAHTVLPKQMRAMRLAAVRTIPPAAAALLLCLGLGSAALSTASCTPAQFANDVQETMRVAQIVLSDLGQGKTKAQILVDVGAELGGKPGVAVADAVIAAVDLLEALNLIPQNILASAHLLKSDLLADKAAAAAARANPTIPLTATPALR
jgi:hypothetical protein